MDRELDSGYIWKRRRRRIGWTLAFLASLIAIGILLPGWLRPSVSRALIRTGIVDRGTVEGIVEASGQVVPAFDGVLSSPVEARLVAILKRPGEVVAAGEEILSLDTSASRVELERLEDQLRKKLNEQEQLRIGLEGSLASLNGRIAAARLDLEALLYRADQSKALRGEGLIAEQALRAAEVDAKKARIELEQLEASAASDRRSTAASLAGLDLDLAMLRRDRDEARRQLHLATTRAPFAGVVTWVSPSVGATVRKGEVVARLADLDSFLVEARVSDIHSARLRTGAAVRVRLGEVVLSGVLASIDPTIEGGAVKFRVALEDPRSSLLRNNLSVDVLVVGETRASALRAPRGPYLQGGAVEKVFVVDRGRPDRAVLREVRLGLSGYDRYEVLDGLSEGDEVIVSDLRDYLHLSWIFLK
jgi:HlyD family secretion protein